jgi:chromosome segregation ATPase
MLSNLERQTELVSILQKNLSELTTVHTKLESEKSRLTHYYESLKVQMSQIETSHAITKRDLVKANEQLTSSVAEQEKLLLQIKEKDAAIERKSSEIRNLEKSIMEHNSEMDAIRAEVKDLRTAAAESCQQLKAIQGDRDRILVTNDALVRSNNEKEVRLIFKRAA